MNGMRTKMLLSIAAVVLGIPGLALLFAPDIAVDLLGGTGAASALLAQLAGGMAIALAVNDRMARGTLMGGIHGRPLLVANLCAFTISGLSLLKADAPPAARPWLVGTGVLLLAFAAMFGRLLFVHPRQ